MPARYLTAALIVAVCVVTKAAGIGTAPLTVPSIRGNAAAVTGADAALTFVPNHGQLDSRVAYYAQGGGYAMFFTDERVVLAFPSNAQDPARSDAKAGSAIALRFVDARIDVKPEASELTPTRVNYLVGADPARWRTALPTYREIRYRDLWPGVDVRFVGDAKRLKYEFIVHPGASVDRIALAYEGAESLTINDGGDLVVSTQLGPLIDERPVSFQDIDGRREPVPSRFRLTRAPNGQQRYGFAIDAFAADHALIIDPGLVYSTYLGGSGDDVGRSVAVGRGGDVFIAGSTESPDLPATIDAFDRTCGNDGHCNVGSVSFVPPDVFVAKLDATGAVVYATYLGGSRSDGGNFEAGPAIALDAEDNIYLAGATDSADFPTTAGAFSRILGGNRRDAFLAKLDSSGTALLYSTFLGGSGFDSGHGIAVDADGDAYVVGVTPSSDFPVVHAFDPTRNGLDDAFVAKFRPSAAGADSLVYSTFLGGSRRDVAYGVAVDGAGRVSITGGTRSANFPLAGAFDDTFNSNQFFSDVFVAQLSADGQTLLYGTYLGGTGSEEGNAIAVDAAGHVFITGYTESSAFPVSAGAYGRRFSGTSLSSDAFVARLDPAAAGAASLVYSTFLGGGSFDAGRAIAVDSTGATWVTGWTRSYGTFDPPGRDSTEVFVAKLNDTASSLLYGEYFGGSGSDAGYGIAVDHAGVAYVTGSTESIDFPVTATAFDATCGTAGNCDPHPRFGFLRSDAFLLKIAPGGGERGIAMRGSPQAMPRAAMTSPGARLQMPSLFVRNHGQMDPRVSFARQQRDMTVYFTADRVVFAFMTPSSGRTDQPMSITPVSLASSQQKRGAKRLVPLALTFVNARRSADVQGRREATARINYLHGNDAARWNTGVASYSEIVYPDLWPGIDLVFRDESGRMKYELVVHPGADLRTARLTYDGAKTFWVDQQGNLQIETSAGIIADERPHSYQIVGDARVPIDSRFVVERSGGRATFGFAVAADYNPRYPLVVDPGLLWSTYLGGSGEDRATSIAVDAAGGVYVAGSTESPDFPLAAGGFDPLCGSDGRCNEDPRFGNRRQDAFVAKFSASGELVYATFLGGSSFDGPGLGEDGGSIAADRAGNVYLTGVTSSPDFPTTDSAYDRTLNGSSDAYLIKLDATGSRLLYGTYFGGSNSAPGFGAGDSGRALAIDDRGHVYLTGRTLSRDFPTTAGAFDRTYNSAIVKQFVDFLKGGDAFVAKFNPSAAGAASLVYSTYVGGEHTDRAVGIAVDAAGQAYVGGSSQSTNLPLPGAFDGTYNGGFSGDGWLFKLDALGAAILYGTYLGGNLSDDVAGVAVDARGHAYVVGSVESSNFPTTAHAYDPVFSGAWPIGDAFVAKIDTTRGGIESLVYSTYLGGSSIEGAAAVAVDQGGAAYIAGFTRSFGMFDRSGHGNSYDGFVAKLDPTGSHLMFGRYLGGSDFDHASGVAVDAGGAAYVAGYTRSTDFPTTDNAFDRTCGIDGACDRHPVFRSTRADVFVVKVAPGNTQ